MNLQSEEYTNTKTFCEDLTEGKYSYPVIHSIQSNPNDLKLQKILRMHTEDIPTKKYALNLLTKSKSLEHTRKVIEQYKTDVLHKIGQFGGNQDLERIVDKLSISQ